MRSISGNKMKSARSRRASGDIGQRSRIIPGPYRRGGVGSSPPPSAIDSRIDESAWMFFMR